MLSTLAAFAELEHSNIKAQQIAGIARVNAIGQKLGATNRKLSRSLKARIDAYNQRNRSFFSYPLERVAFRMAPSTRWVSLLK